VTDCEKIVSESCKLAGVDALIMKEAEIWPLAKTFLEGEKMGSEVILEKIKTTIGDKKFLLTSHITLADIFAALPGIRAFKKLSKEKTSEWLIVYKWILNLLNLPYIGDILYEKEGGLDIGEELVAKQESKEEQKDVDTKKDKKKKAKEKAKEKAKKEPEISPFGQLDIRVGKIVKAAKHPDSTKLYIEEVDIGGEIRKIASGLQEFVPIEEFQDCNVIVFCNLKPKSLAGYMSHGMLLCASNKDYTQIELLIPPEGAKPGDPVIIEGLERRPIAEINLSKHNNPWNKVEKLLSTDEGLAVVFEGKKLITSGGVVKTKSLKGAQIS
jgi:methionine--tRNA ligase beta chain